MKNKLVWVLLMVIVLVLGWTIISVPFKQPTELPKVVEPAVIPPISIPTAKPAMEKPGEVIGTEITVENIFNGVNQERYKVGLKILVRDAKLDKIANDKLQDMLKYGYWAHDNPTTGEKWYSFFTGYNYIYAGENLARYFSTVQDTINGWMMSEEHKSNILKREYTKTGIAISGNLVVQEFVGQ